MLKITEQILFTIKNSNKMLIDVNTQVKKPIEHKTFYKKKKKKIVLLKFPNITVKTYTNPIIT